MSRIVCRLVALTVVLPLGPVFAATPLGGDDPGFVPPSKPILRCEDAVWKIFSKHLACLVVCHVKAGTATFKGRPFDDEPCERACSATFVKKQTALNAKKGCPPCITQVDPTMQAMADEQGIDAAVGLVACAGATPIGGDDTGFLPPKDASGKCELAVGKNAAKLLKAVARCHVRQADAAFKSKHFDEEKCEDAAASKFNAANKKLKGCPACLDAPSVGSAIRAALDSDEIYCAE